MVSFTLVRVYRYGSQMEAVFPRFMKELPRLVAESLEIEAANVATVPCFVEWPGTASVKMALVIEVPFTPERRYLHDTWYVERLRRSIRSFYPPGSPSGGIPLSLRFPQGHTTYV